MEIATQRGTVRGANVIVATSGYTSE